MNVKIGVSARHIHLTQNTYKKLFGDEELTKLKDLNQIGEFASTKTLTIKTDKNLISNVRVLGPLRDYDQVEISRTDAINLGLNPPLRKSGNIENTPGIVLIGSKNEVELKEGVIIAERHIHMDKNMAQKLSLKDNDPVKVIIDGTKGILKGIVKEEIIALIKITDNAYFEMHIDTDDANALGLKSGDEVTLEI